MQAALYVRCGESPLHEPISCLIAYTRTGNWHILQSLRHEATLIIRQVYAAVNVTARQYARQSVGFLLREFVLDQNLSHYVVARPLRPLAKKEPGFWARPRRERLVERLCRALGMAMPAEVNILGYGGFWLMAGEAHISTIAVRPEWRRQGIGELVLVAMLEQAVESGADLATLEVRASNVAAQNLYQKYGFAKVGLRPHYSDRGEDALIMTTKHLTSAAFQSGFQRLKVVPDQIDKGNRIGYNKLDGRCLDPTGIGHLHNKSGKTAALRAGVASWEEYNRV